MFDRSPVQAPEFHYRNNGDGTWDSICLRCFLTVGSAVKVEDLADAEAAHTCYTKRPAKAERLEKP